MPVASGSDAGGVYAVEFSHTLDEQRVKHRAELVRIACDIAAVAQSYKTAHRTLYGFSMRSAWRSLLTNRSRDFTELEIELDSIQARSKQVQNAIDNLSLNDQHGRARTATAIRGPLKEYANAVSNVTLNLKLICTNLRRESEGEQGFVDYSGSSLQRDKAVYDSSLQEFRRWGMRLTELFEKL